MIRILSAAAALLALGACTAEFGAPDIGRGSAESPATMLVDQNMNGVPTQGGTQRMVGASSWVPGAAPVTRASTVGTSFGRSTTQPIPPQGGERR